MPYTQSWAHACSILYRRVSRDKHISDWKRARTILAGVEATVVWFYQSVFYQNE